MNRYFAFVITFLVFVPTLAHGASLTFVSDLVSSSVVNSTTTTHTIKFTANRAIPASGTITIVPQGSAFIIPADLDVNDIDVLVNTSGTYVDRSIASIQTPTEDGVTIVSGAGGSISIRLASTLGIPQGARVQILVGTNAVAGSLGVHNITNPSAIGSYRIALSTYDAVGTLIDAATAMVAMVRQVTVTITPTAVPPLRFGGLPAGSIPSRASSIEISLQTDQRSICRYSTTPGVQYAAMTNTFNNIANLAFYKVITGHQDGTSYTYYVRCFALQGVENQDDYEITFALRATEVIPTPGIVGSIYPPGAGGPGGAGEFRNGSDVLYRSAVTVSGWASPQSTISILTDGVQSKQTQAASDGSFSAKVGGLERGTYSFTVFAEDSKQRQSAPHTETIDVTSGTNNTISEIVIPPTASFDDNSINPGESARLSGQSVPRSIIEMTLIARGKSDALTAPKKFSATTTADGSWSATIAAKDIPRGQYLFKARTIVSSDSRSEFGKPLSLGVGEEASKDTSNRSDINKDGKVNLVDFSILLSAWGKTEGDADINLDGKINLADVSILLFNWTG